MIKNITLPLAGVLLASTANAGIYTASPSLD